MGYPYDAYPSFQASINSVIISPNYNPTFRHTAMIGDSNDLTSNHPFP